MPPRHRMAGVALIECVIIVPTFFLLVMAVLQAGLALHAHSTLTLAVNEAARAGSLSNASEESLRDGLSRGLAAYYTGGSGTVSMLLGREAALADLALHARVEILSPTKESFDDHESKALKKRLDIDERVIPVANLAARPCQADDANKCDPAHNASGQSLADATLLKVRVTWGLPTEKQVPLAGRFWIWALTAMQSTDGDVFRRALIADNRIPMQAQATVRMQSPPIENDAMKSNPGPGNDGKPEDKPLEPTDPLPSCPFYNPTCVGVPPDPDDNEPPFCPGT